MKTLVVVDKKTRKVICVVFSNGKQHDFRLFKESQMRINKDTAVEVDSGFQGIKDIHANSVLPKKRTKHTPLTKEEKRQNKEKASQRATNEHAIGFIKRFKILSERYRNRRKRFGLRFNLLAGICNFDMVV
jgi:hypothetical protein